MGGRGKSKVATVALSLFVWLFTSLAGSGVATASLPPYDGIMEFPAIHSPFDPEEFSWEVHLGAEQELRQLDDQHAAVFYEDGVEAMQITPELAHDATGASVPTSLAVSEPNVLTLIVHHRAGNPAAGGAPFDYPIIAGAGWEGGIPQPIVIKGPPDEQELREARERAEKATPAAKLPPPGVRFVHQVRSFPCGKVRGIPIHAHRVTCRAARHVYKADSRGEVPEGWICSASLARCYKHDFHSGLFMWWKRTTY
jgi:hypothetical protein